jgi:ferredoxin-NADP reductase
VRARIVDKREVAEGTLFVVFDLLEEEVDFTPGQYFWVELPDRGLDDERGLRRHVSVATSPTERGVLGLATRVRDSAFKQTLAQLEVGDEVDVEQPKGDFLLPPEDGGPYAFVAGGIGISVFRCMLRYIADEGLGHRVTLVYSNRDRASTAFLDELEEIERRAAGLRLVLTMTEDPEWDGETRMVDEAMLRDVLGDQFDETTFLVAGPPGMVDAVVETLEGAGLPEEQIRPDRFSGY